MKRAARLIVLFTLTFAAIALTVTVLPLSTSASTPTTGSSAAHTKLGVSDGDSARAAGTYKLVEVTNRLDATLTVDGVPFTDEDGDYVVQDGDVFEFGLSYELTNDSLDADEHTVFTYELPIDWLPLNNAEGTIFDPHTGSEVGSYTVEDNLVRIKYTAAFLSQSDRASTFNLKGVVSIDEDVDWREGLEIPLSGGGSVHIDIRNDQGLKIEKTATKRVQQDSREAFIDYTVTVTAARDNRNVVIIDTRSGGSTLVESTVKVVTEGVVGSVTGPSTASGGTKSTWNVSSMEEGSKVVLTYSCAVDAMSREHGAVTYTNTAAAESRETTSVKDGTSTSVRQVTGSKKGERDGSTITWTMHIYPGEFDTICINDHNNRVTPVPSNAEVKIYRVKRDGTKTKLTSTTFGAINAPSEYRYKDPQGTADVSYYEFVYDALADTNLATEHNWLRDCYSGEQWEAAVGTGISTESKVGKNYVSHDIAKRTITWDIHFTLANDWPAVSDDSYCIEDLGTSNANFHTSAESLDVTFFDGKGEKIDIAYKTNAHWAANGSNLIITFPEGIDAGVYTARVTSQYDATTDLEIVAENRVYLRERGALSKQGWDRRPIRLNYITKSNSASGIEESERYLEWTINIAANLPTGPDGHAVITDTLPDGLEFISATFAGSPIEPTSHQGNVLTFDVTGAKANQKLVIRTQVKDWITSDAAHTLTNRARLDADFAYPEVSATATVQPPVGVTKGYVYDESTAPNVHYTVVVNPDAVQMLPDESDVTTITARDTMGAALMLRDGSLLVNGEAWDDVEIRGRTIIVRGLPDKTKLTLTYQATLSLDPGTEIEGEDAANKVEVDGVRLPQSSTTTKITGRALTGTASGTASSWSISLFKSDESDEPVAGAQFELKAYGTGTTPIETGSLVATIESNADGSVSIHDSAGASVDALTLGFDTIYRLEETVVPNGYDQTRPWDSGYFVRPGGSSAATYGPDVEVYQGFTTMLFEPVNYRLGSFAFTKSDGISETGLPGATFMLFRYDGAGAPSSDLVDTQAPGDWSAVDGGVQTSGADGFVKFEGLAVGSYRLIETAAPDGYLLPAGQWSFEVEPASDGRLATTLPQAVWTAATGQPPAFATDGASGALTLPNYQPIGMPSSGGGGVVASLAAGAVCLAVGVAVWMRRDAVARLVFNGMDAAARFAERAIPHSESGGRSARRKRRRP